MTHKTQLGKLPPRYRFALNPHQETRFTKCANCNQRTLLRKVPLAVHVDPHHPVMLNKHCRYCPNCDILLAHQDELEHMLALTFEERAPEVIGNNYLVMGTFDKSTWRKREKEPLTMGTLLDHLHPFKEYLKIEYTPAHWGPADEEYPHISKLEAEKRREQGLSPPSKSTRRRRKRKKKS